MPGIQVTKWTFLSLLIASSLSAHATSESVTLRINMTGLIAYGPLSGVQEDMNELWVLAAEASGHSHWAWLKYGCDADGTDCAPIKLKGQDLHLFINGSPAAGSSKLRVDHSFRAYVGDLYELGAATRPMGHHACSGPVFERRLPPTRTPLMPLDGLLRALDDSDPPKSEHLAKVAFRLRLTGGFALDDQGKCDGGDHCGGKLSAKDVAVCGRWTFPAANPRCTRLADTVVYELRIEKGDGPISIEFKTASHSDYSELTYRIPVNSKVVEVWLVNASDQPITNGEPMTHFEALYNLFPDRARGPQLPHKAFPKYDENGYARCEDLPGLKSVKCPGMLF